MKGKMGRHIVFVYMCPLELFSWVRFTLGTHLGLISLVPCQTHFRQKSRISITGFHPHTQRYAKHRGQDKEVM